MKFLALIPARYASTRFPGKPLADIFGKSMIQRVYERVSEVFDDCYVATDDDRIFDAVTAFGGRAVMTGTHHRSGTDRLREAMESIGGEFDVVVNIQGDEPFVDISQLEQIKKCFDDPSTAIATLVKPFGADEDIFNPNSPKVVVSADNFALYFSRSTIPYIRGEEAQEWRSKHVFYKHIGLYAYRRAVLCEITSLPAGVLEKAESLEQLRWLENGYRIKVAVTESESYAIDTPEDLEAVKMRFKNL